MDGIEELWESLIQDVCKKYIGHLNKVMPKLIEVNGNPSDTNCNYIVLYVTILTDYDDFFM